MKDEIVNIRMPRAIKKKLQKRADALGFSSLSEYLRVCGLHAELKIFIPKEEEANDDKA